MRVHRLLLNATALRTHRYGKGSERHNVSLLPGTWERLSHYTAEEGEDNNSALIQIGIGLVEAVLWPTDANMGKAVALVTVGFGGESETVLALVGNLRELAERLEQASQEVVEPATDSGQAGKESV